jgi:hypothetical protein
MALIAIAADKGAPGVTTTALAMAAVWPRPVLLAECDPAGGDLVYRFPDMNSAPLDPRRGMLSLAVAARRGGRPEQVWEHTQRLHGGLDVLTGVTNAEQGSGLHMFWGPLGKLLAAVPQADVIADCGRIGADGPNYDLLAESSAVMLITRPEMGEVVRLRDRVNSIAAGLDKRGRRGFRVAVAVVADQKNFRSALGEVGQVVAQHGPAVVLGGIADDAKAAAQLGGGWGGRLDKSLLIRSVRDIAEQISSVLPPLPTAGIPASGTPAPPQMPPAEPARTQYPSGEQYQSGEQHYGPMPQQPPVADYQPERRRGRHTAASGAQPASPVPIVGDTAALQADDAPGGR